MLLKTPGVGEHEVPRDFGYAGKNKQVQPIFPTVPCVKEAFYKQKAEDGEGHAANVAAKAVDGYGVVADGEEGDFSRGVIVQQNESAVVDEHGDYGNQFQGTAAEDAHFFREEAGWGGFGHSFSPVKVVMIKLRQRWSVYEV